MTPREQQIMDAADAGAEPATIAADLGLAERYVRQVIRSYTVTAGEPWAKAARFGSRQLLRAIRRHHPDLVTPRGAA